MISVEKCIRELLFEQECVIIPEFGGFITKYKSAVINHFGQVIYPPTKSISFNRQLKNDDGLLVNTYAQLNQIPFSEAAVVVKSWVANFSARLNQEHSNSIERVGKFTQTAEGIISFELATGENYLSESYGLPTVSAVAIQRSSDAESILKQITLESVSLSETSSSRVESIDDEVGVLDAEKVSTRAKSRFSYIAVAVLSILLIASTVLPIANVNIKPLNIDEASIYSLVSAFKPNHDIEIAPIAIDAKAVGYSTASTQMNFSKPVFVASSSETIEPISTPKTETAVPVLSKAASSLKYMVVAGVFREQANAERLLNDLSGKKINAPIREVKRGSVSYIGFDGGMSESEAITVMNQARQLAIECWIKKM
jgi:cell division septation protein DedD